ncbi:MAG TPA: hypothetical protein VF911_05770, partial [Thermoanaerobaculia bacterium]
FRRWLASQELTCVAGSAPGALPPGLWNVFARAEGAISAAPLLLDGNAAPSTVAPELVPGATVAPLLPEKHTGVFYAPRRGSAFPADAARVRVPADEPLWLFVLDSKAMPVAILPIAALAPGTERTVDARSGGPASLVGWLHVPPADREAVAKASAMTSPAVVAGGREADPLPAPSMLHGAFFRIQDVAPGSTDVRLAGRGWVPDRRAIKVQRGLAVAAAPLLVRGAGTLIVHWNTEDDLPALDRAIGSCEDENGDPQLTIAVFKCSRPPRGEELELADCALMAEEKVEGTFGSTAFEDVVPGLYRAQMRFGKLPPASSVATVGPLRVADLRIRASYFTLYGSVTRGGEPLDENVRIEFREGIGFAPESKDYAAVFRRPLLASDEQIHVDACDGAPRAVVLTDQPIRPLLRFDIDIPDNELTLRMSDTFTREPLGGAIVKLEAMSVLRPPRVVYETKSVADERGSVVWSGVPVRELHLTVSLTGYQTQRIPPFSLTKSEKKSLDVQLVPLRGTRGKVVSERPFENASVAWFSSGGSMVEWVDLAADGTFVYVNRHGVDETMAVLSTSHPLWVLRAPVAAGRETISVTFPVAPAVAFDVWLGAAVPPNESRHIGIIIGGVRVPQPVLEQHQTLRRDALRMHGAGPQHFRDLLATGPIDVILGPVAEDVSSRGRVLDLFALPQYADAPRERLEPGAADVVLTVE